MMKHHDVTFTPKDTTVRAHINSNLEIEKVIFDLRTAEKRADKEGWIDADVLEKELHMY